MTISSFPGVTVTRRSFLGLSALAGLPVAGSARASEALDFAAFTRLCSEVIRAEGDDARAHAEPLLLRLAAAGACLQPAGVPRPALAAFGGYEPKVSFGPVHREPSLFVIEWRFEPDAVLPAHSHTPGLVLSLCLEGECRIEHFEIVGDAPAPGSEGSFRMRRTRAQLLRPGHATSLTPERDGIHTFRAGPRGALGIDLNVVLPGDGDWSMISHEERPERGFEELHDARWIGKPA